MSVFVRRFSKASRENVLFEGVQSRLAQSEKFSLNFSNSSFVVRVNFLHP